MKKSDHLARLGKVAITIQKTTKITINFVKDAKAWPKEANKRAEQISNTAIVMANTQKEISEYVASYGEVVQVIGQLERDFEQESDDKKKKSIEAEHKKMNKVADGMIKTLNEMLGARMNQIVDGMIEASTLAPLKKR